MTDPHDPRDFRNFVTLNPDGSVRAVHQFDASIEDPLPGAIDITDLGPADFSTVTIDPALLTAHATAKDALSQQLAAIGKARGDVFTATAKITDAINVAIQSAKAAPVVASVIDEAVVT